MLPAQLMNPGRFLFIGLIFLLGTSCSMARAASNLTSNILKEGSPVFEEEQDVEVAEQTGLAMIKTLEVFHHQNPKNKNYLLLLSKSYGTYGFGFLENRLLQYEQKDPERYKVYLERAKLFYSRGKNYGLQLIEREDKDLRKAIDQGLGPLKGALAGVGKSDAAMIFWTALSWGNYVNLTKDEVRSVSDLAIVEVMMARVLELDPGFFYGGPHLFYGVYYASRPTMLGGNPEEAKKHFEEASKSSEGRFLLPYVLQAQFLAVQTQDRNLFNDLIGKVESGDPNAMPEQKLANMLAKERVRYLRDREKELF
ncbi:MAG: hypothetical protein HY542_00655 [Deltaproteobacteria bacterium]|nr:hypothetical protein [Deltaproteobacteria bacterium]